MKDEVVSRLGIEPRTSSRHSRSPALLSTAHCAVSPGFAGTVLAPCKSPVHRRVCLQLVWRSGPFLADRLWWPCHPLPCWRRSGADDVDTRGGLAPPADRVATGRPPVRTALARAGAPSGNRTRIPRSTIWCPGRWTMRTGGPGRIRTGIGRVRSGHPAVGRQANGRGCGNCTHLLGL